MDLADRVATLEKEVANLKELIEHLISPPSPNPPATKTKDK
jgi:hypothetical protein